MLTPTIGTSIGKRPRVELGRNVLTSLRVSAREYGERLPELPHFSIDELCKKTASLTEEVLNTNGYGIYTLGGFPASGKSNKSENIQGSVIQALGGGPRGVMVPVYPDGHRGVARAYVCGKNGKINGLSAGIHTDESFNDLGPARRRELLEYTKAFQRGWVRRNGPTDHVRYVLTGDRSDVRIYLGTPEEKEKLEPLGRLELTQDWSRVVSEIPGIILVEGVDAALHIDRIKAFLQEMRDVKIQTLNILFDLPPEHSIVKVLGRDHDLKGYRFYDILKHRVLENYYIMKEFILTAYNTPNTVLLDPKRRIPYFSRLEREEILYSIDELEKEVMGDSSLGKKQKKRDFMLMLLLRTRLIIEELDAIRLSLDDSQAWRTWNELRGTPQYIDESAMISE